MLADHQLSAIARLRGVIDAVGGAILADEPGLGKSFVAASYARGEPDVELIIPASLRQQWSETLAMFGVTARILTHDGIVSDPFVPDAKRRLVIVDEAHAFRNPRTQRYEALARRTAGARVLLLTATPVCNRLDDLRALVDIVVADDGLARVGVPSIDVAFDTRDALLIAAVVRQLVIRRSRDALPEHLQFGSLHRRVIRHEAGTRAIAEAIERLEFPLVSSSAIVRQFLWRRLESSEAALLESLRRQRRFYERALECLATGRALPKREYRRVFAHEEDADSFQQVLFWEVFVPDASTAAPGDIEDEMHRIDELASLVASHEPAKRSALLDLLAHSSQPALVFTGWAATASDLFQHISRVRRAALATGRNRRDADSAIASFRNGAIDVLVSTDLAAEGLNLQRAGLVVHYDIPWNPVKLEQRDGRAHRIGQQRPSIDAVYFIPRGTRGGVMPVVAAKNRARRRAMRMEPPPASEDPPALRPRIGPGAAIVRFAKALESRGWSVPPELLRRHRIGFEQLLASMSTEFIDAARLGDLAALAEFEPWGRSRPVRFTHL